MGRLEGGHRKQRMLNHKSNGNHRIKEKGTDVGYQEYG